MICLFYLRLAYPALPIFTPITLADGTFSKEDVIADVVSWIILCAVNIGAVHQISEIIRERGSKIFGKGRRANEIAIVVGLILLVFIFKQPYLDKIFGDYSSPFWVQSSLFVGGMIAGWIVWSLKHIARYGEFFDVLLLTLISGLCWYARLTAPEEIHLAIAAFLLGSLLRVARDYLDEMHRIEI